MLTPEFLDNATDKLDSLIYQFENNTIQDIAKRISKTVQQDGATLTSTAEYQLSRLSELRGFDAFYKAELSRITALSFVEIDELIMKSAEQSYSYDLSRFLERNLTPLPELGGGRLQQMIDALRHQTKGSFENITRTSGFAGLPTQQYFTRTLDNAVMQVSSGLFDYNTVVKRTVQEMTKSGLQTVTYGQRNLNVVTAVRNNVMTACRHIADEVSILNAEDLGLNLIETSAHLGARPSHIVWQGKRFSFNSIEEIRAAKII